MHRATNYTQPASAAGNRTMTTSTVMGMIPRRKAGRGCLCFPACLCGGVAGTLPVLVEAQQTGHR